MKKLLTTIGLVILAALLIILGWFIYQSFQSNKQSSGVVGWKSEQTLQEETAQKAVGQVPELNPIEKTNPFSGSYKNPFKK
jgi:hypothetical protein